MRALSQESVEFIEGLLERMSINPASPEAPKLVERVQRLVRELEEIKSTYIKEDSGSSV